MNNLVSEKELAEILQLSRSTINRLRKQGMPFIKIGKSVRYDLEAVKKWIQNN
jgi:5-methylcytosine-specific restriction protein A